MKNHKIGLVRSGEDIRRCYQVMVELRPGYSREVFVRHVEKQVREYRYRLVMLEADGEVAAVAGFRIGECLAWGRYMYVYDLVTAAKSRSGGHGAALLDWLIAYAREDECGELHLDSGVQRFEAHRFYLRQRMKIASHHFSIQLRDS